MTKILQKVSINWHFSQKMSTQIYIWVHLRSIPCNVWCLLLINVAKLLVEIACIYISVLNVIIVSFNVLLSVVECFTKFIILLHSQADLN